MATRTVPTPGVLVRHATLRLEDDAWLSKASIHAGLRRCAVRLFMSETILEATSGASM
ncbi:MAG: hypothetical protein ACERNK_17060 [Deltaproteobacteria bacterium]